MSTAKSKKRRFVTVQTNDPTTNPLNFIAPDKIVEKLTVATKVEAQAQPAPAPEATEAAAAKTIARAERIRAKRRLRNLYAAHVEKYLLDNLWLFMDHANLADKQEASRRIPFHWDFVDRLVETLRQHHFASKLIVHQACGHVYPILKGSKEERLFDRCSTAVVRAELKVSEETVDLFWSLEGLPRYSEDQYVPVGDAWTPGGPRMFQRLPSDSEFVAKLPEQIYAIYQKTDTPGVGNLVDVSGLNRDSAKYGGLLYGISDRFSALTDTDINYYLENSPYKQHPPYCCGACGIYRMLCHSAGIHVRVKEIFNDFFTVRGPGDTGLVPPKIKVVPWSNDHIQLLVNLGLFVYNARKDPIEFFAFCKQHYPEEFQFVFE